MTSEAMSLKGNATSRQEVNPRCAERMRICQVWCLFGYAIG